MAQANTRANTRGHLISLINNAANAAQLTEQNTQLTEQNTQLTTNLSNAKRTLLDYDLLMYQIEKKKNPKFGANVRDKDINETDEAYDRFLKEEAAVITQRVNWIKDYYNIQNDNLGNPIRDGGVTNQVMLEAIRTQFDNNGSEAALTTGVFTELEGYLDVLMDVTANPITITRGGNNEVNVNRLPTSLKRRYSEIMNRINNLKNLVGGRRNKKSRSRSRSNSRKQNGGKKSPSKTVKRASPKKRSPKRK